MQLLTARWMTVLTLPLLTWATFELLVAHPLAWTLNTWPPGSVPPRRAAGCR